MDQIQSGVKTFDKTVGNFLDKTIKTPTFVRAVVHLLLMLYVARIAPSPPKQILDLFENTYFRLFVFAIVLWTAQFSPSTSILIALAFLVTVNYTTTGKVWELLENTEEAPILVPVTPDDSAKAVEVLAQAAASPEASAPEDVQQIATVAMANVKTEEGANAVNALAQQAVVPEAGVTEKVQEAVVAAVESIAPATQSTPEVSAAPEAAPTPEPPVMAAVTPEESAKAVEILAQAAVSPEASAPEAVQQVATLAMANVKTAEGAEAVKTLAEQAAVPEAGVSEKVQEAAVAAVESIITPVEPAAAEAEAPPAPTTVVPAPQEKPKLEGCYPMRRYDMSKVMPYLAGEVTAEDYQLFTASA